MELLRALENYSDDMGNVVLYEGEPIEKPVSIRFRGTGNVLEVASDAKIIELSVEFFGNNGRVQIAGTPLPRTGLRFGIRVGHDSTVSIGKNVGSQSRTFIVASEGADVSIGEDCMLASGIEIRTDDSHPIYDVRTQERVNLARSIHIGDHVWIGKFVAILGGASVGNGSVVGFRSVLTRKIPNNCVAAGVPARVLRKDIAWERPKLNARKPGQTSVPAKEKHDEYWNLTDFESEVPAIKASPRKQIQSANETGYSQIAKKKSPKRSLPLARQLRRAAHKLKNSVKKTFG